MIEKRTNGQREGGERGLSGGGKSWRRTEDENYGKAKPSRTETSGFLRREDGIHMCDGDEGGGCTATKRRVTEGTVAGQKCEKRRRAKGRRGSMHRAADGSPP